MKFTNLINERKEGGNPEKYERIVDLIHKAIDKNLINWDSQYTTEEFIQILGITRRELDHFIVEHQFYDDHITLVYSGNRHQNVHLGKNPNFYVDKDGKDPEEIAEGVKVSTLDKKEQEKLFDKYLSSMKKDKKKLSPKELKKHKSDFTKMDLLSVGKTIKG